MSWNCSEEFEASSSDPFGLVYPNSYVISRVAISRQGTIVKMNIRPMFDDGLIFYVSGMSSRPDYLAVELRKGKVQRVNKLLMAFEPRSNFIVAGLSMWLCI